VSHSTPACSSPRSCPISTHSVLVYEVSPCCSSQHRLTQPQDHPSALALVSARSSSSIPPASLQTSTTLDLQSEGASDPDLRRPHELQTLHDNIKLAYGSKPHSGPTPAIRELQEARSSVNRALESLGLGVEGERNASAVSAQQLQAQSQHNQQAQHIPHTNMPMDEDDRQDAEYDDDEMAAWS
jgi:hypothetical protein